MSEVLQVHKLNAIDAKTKLIVGGFVKSIQTALPDTSTFYNIPPSIIDIILIYYYAGDEFNISSDNVEIRNKGKNIIVAKPAAWSAAYGTFEIDSESDIHCYWKIKCIKRTNTSFIGITSNKIVTEIWNYYQGQDHIMYCMYSEGQIWSFVDGKSNKQFLNPMRRFTNRIYKEGDIITLDFNLKNKETKYMVNDKEISLSHKNIKIGQNIKYYLAVSVLGGLHEMSIIDFGFIST